MGYLLLARLPASINRRELRASLYDMMLPYKMERRGAPDPPELKNYMVFVDSMNSLREAWEEDTREVIRENDRYYYAFDERYKVECVEDGRYRSWVEIPKDAARVEVPIKELYSCFEDFAKDSADYNEDTGSYGYWTNPKGKWENYYIGRRYPTPLKNLRLLNGSVANFARLCSIKFDFEKIEMEKEKAFDDFWKTYEELFRTKVLLKDRDSIFLVYAMELGFMRESHNEHITDEERNNKELLIFPSGWKGDDWFFLFRPITYEEALKGKECFFRKYLTWARLDKDGWEDCGETPDELIIYANTHKFWLTRGNQRDWLFALMCRP